MLHDTKTHGRPALRMMPATLRRETVFGCCLVLSAALHLLWLQLSQPAFFGSRPFRAGNATLLRLTLAPRMPPAAVPSSVPSSAPGPRVPQPAQAAPPRAPHALRALSPLRAATPAGAVTPPDTPVGPTAAPAEPVTAADAQPAAAAQATRVTSGDIMAAATREAAAIAREMNRAPDARQQFRSKTQENLDRRFDAAHAAGGSWLRAARVEEITTTGDGNARVYRIVTPFGPWCRKYPADGSPPMNTLCPPE